MKYPIQVLESEIKELENQIKYHKACSKDDSITKHWLSEALHVISRNNNRIKQLKTALYVLKQYYSI